ncbi:tRNA pseudouridine(13) synthase TruD [Candidatus Woesearchaeota archaeon]|nr:tRNA pseudouridine(13) synthase TruD [Candidatus Woesearchaeota archaeon]
MKYRQKTDDFIVEEIANHNVLNKGKFKLYSLEKEGVETFALIETLSGEFNIPRNDLGIAGMKDTYALTKQYITVPSKYDLRDVDDIRIDFLGYLNQPIRLGDLDSNKFEITVRDINEIENIKKNAEQIEYGIPNYFDSQRFGSVVNNEFIGRLLVKKDYEGAMKLYLTSISENDSEERAKDKERILESWGVFDIEIYSHDLKRIISEYKRTNKWIIAYKYITASLRQLFISSYQSYIWNECIKELLRQNVESSKLFSIPYAVDELVFCKEEMKGLPGSFQTISHRLKPREYEKVILDRVLGREDLEISNFNIRQTGNFFKSHERDVIMHPRDFHLGEAVREGEGYSITVKFSLPKGSYATVVLKEVFGQ